MKWIDILIFVVSALITLSIQITPFYGTEHSSIHNPIVAFYGLWFWVLGIFYFGVHLYLDAQTPNNRTRSGLP